MTHGVRTQGHDQAHAAAGRVGEPTASRSAGKRKGVDALDVLSRADDFNASGTSKLIDLCESLKPEKPSPQEKQRKDLHSTLMDQLNMMKQFQEAGLPCDQIKERIAKLSAKLNDNIDTSFGLEYN